MPRASSDAQLDRLFQLPLNEFTGARNALAKELGPEGADVRALQKPTLPAWAINQLFWRKRDVYNELIERAEDLRATHAAAVRGKSADLRGASKAHEEAVDQALKATLAVLAEDGQPVTDATRQAISTTLRSLPGDEAPGRLTRQLQPRGFEMLAGAASPGRIRVAPAPPPVKVKGGSRAAQTEEAAGKKDETAARAQKEKAAATREAMMAATRAARQAEQAARREEFEAARAARDADKALRQVEQARTALEQAQTELAEAEKAAAAVVKTRDAVQKRAAAATQEMEDAQAAEERARAALNKIT
jgi:hypothetical protein